MNAVVSRPLVCAIIACVFAVLVIMSTAVSAAECAPSGIGVRNQCELTPIIGIHTPVLVDPYPPMAAGWGPELGKGLMASRWAEDWASIDTAVRAPSLKRMSWGEEATLTLSAEARLRYVTFENQQLRRGRDVQQTQFRGMVGADFRVSAGLRFYGELGTGQLDGDRHGATANFQNALSLQQFFVDARRQSGPFLIGMMAGRQEFADGPRQLLSLSDGPNLHRSWNGVRLYAHASRYRFGAFDLRATRLGRDGFDDGIASSERLSGVNASFIISPGESAHIYLDPFWIHSESQALRLGNVAGVDDRNTVGVRLWGRRGKLRFDWTVASQSGKSINERRIDTWGIFAIQSLALSESGWKPQVTSHIDMASGGGAYVTGKIRDFNPLYASSNYLGESQFLGLTNLFLFAPGLSVTPSARTTLSIEYGYARRLDEADAVYGAGMRPYAGTEHVTGRHIGNLARFYAAWAPTPSVIINFNLEHLDPGRVLRNANHPSSTYFYLGATYRY